MLKRVPEKFSAVLNFGTSNVKEKVYRQEDILFKKGQQKSIKLKVMKTQSNNLLEKLVKEEIEVLTNQVREILALDFKRSNDKVFSAAELWNIQRQRKTYTKRRFSF